MDLPGSEHFIFIPGVLLIGIVVGYVMGSRAAQEKLSAARRRRRE
jgi:hypothetical protein